MSNTQSNSSNNTKTVLYYGKEIQVPQEAKWIHTDSDGGVYWSNKELQTRSHTFGTYSLDVECDYITHFNHTEMSTINWMQSQKRISVLTGTRPELEPTPEPTGHPHADLMLKYAQIAQYSDKPWEEFQYKGLRDEWSDCISGVGFNTGRMYRLKPQQVQIQVGQVWESSKTKVKFSVVSTVVGYNTGNLCIELNHTLDVGLDIPYTVTEDTLRKHFQLVK